MAFNSRIVLVVPVGMLQMTNNKFIPLSETVTF